jgi:hypothetical protein
MGDRLKSVRRLNFMNVLYVSCTAVIAVLAGCGARTLELTDESAMSALMQTKHVAALQRQNPTRFVCWVESADSTSRYLYLGENHPDHTVRVGSYRVTSDGRVWVNSDLTYLEDQWVFVE